MADDSHNLQDIYNDFRPRILRYLSRMVGEDEAEDLTQEVFIKIDRALKTFRGESLIVNLDLSDRYQCRPGQTSQSLFPRAAWKIIFR